MSDLADLVEAFKREATIPGSFGAVFPTMTDDHIVGSLSDAFAEAQLDGYFGTMRLDVDDGVVTPDLSVAGAALVVIYAGMRLVRQQLREIRTHVQAGPTVVDRSAGVLTEELKQLERRRKDLLAAAMRAGRGAGTTFVIDLYVARGGYGSFHPYELTAGRW